jgi:hypothetical protein
VVQVPAILQAKALAAFTISAYLRCNQHTASGVYVDDDDPWEVTIKPFRRPR